MKHALDRTPGLALAVSALAGIDLAPGAASAQFSAREGYAPGGAYRISVELTPYLLLPALDASVGLQHPPGFDASVNKPVPSLAQVLDHLNFAFLGEGLVRYGPFSAEADVQYVSAFQKRDFPAGPQGRAATLKSDVSVVRVLPGFGVQVLPVEADSPFMLDVRTGFSYFSTDASTGFQNSRFGGISHTTTLVEPWLGLRGTWIISPDWRFTAEAAGTGFGTNGGAWGWNGRVGVAYLVTSWLDVSLGFDGFQTTLPSGSGAAGQAHALRLLSYGPIVGVGLRF